jgi:multiple sugar transport system substrate-binding protein
MRFREENQVLALRRVTAGAAAAMAVCLVVAGCTADPEATPKPPASPTPSPSASPSAPGGPVTLRFGVYGDKTLRQAYAKVARVYSNAHPDVTVEVEGSRSEAEAVDRLERQFSVGDEPDVFVASDAQVPRLSAEDRVQPVDQLLEARGVTFGDTYQRLGLEAFSAEQALQCMPYDVSPLVILYNQGLVPFRRLVEPGDEPLTPETGWTWEQFTKALRLTSRDGVNGVYVEPGLSPLMALVRSAGADIVDDPRTATTLTLSDDGTRSALEEVLDVLREPRYTPSPEQLARQDAVTRFEKGKIAMLVTTRALVPELRTADDLDFDVFPLPRLAKPRTVADVTGFCLSSTTTHVDEAADFLAFASGEKGATILAETGAVVPAHLPTLNSLAFTQPGEQPESVLTFGEAVARAGVTPYVPAWPQLEAAMRPELERMFYAPVIDLDEMLPRMDEESARILAPEPATDG